jgi:hypothetical protein
MSEVVAFGLVLTGPALLGLAAWGALAAALGVAVDWLVRVGSTPLDQVDSEFLRAYRAARRRSLGGPLPQALAEARAALEALEAQPALAELAGRFRPGALRAARELAAGAGAEGEAAAALACVRGCLGETRGILADLRRRAVGLAAAEALSGLGYRVRAAVGAGQVALWADRGEHAVALVVEGDGRATMDLVGFDGLGCRAETDRILAELGRRGFGVRRLAGRLHGRRSGGELAGRVGRLVRELGAEPVKALTADLPAAWSGEGPADPGRVRRLLARSRARVGGEGR